MVSLTEVVADLVERHGPDFATELVIPLAPALHNPGRRRGHESSGSAFLDALELGHLEGLQEGG